MSVFRKKNALPPAFSWRGTPAEPGILVHYRSDHHERSDALFWCLSWLALLLHLHLLVADAHNFAQHAYRWLLIGSYALMLMVPAWLLARPLAWLARPVQLTGQVLLVGLMHLVTYTDNQLWTAQQLHLNDLSSGGALDFLRSLDLFMVVLGFLTIQVLLRSLASLVILFAPRLPLPGLRLVLILFLAATCGERLGYALGHYEHNRALQRMAQEVPFHQPLVIDDYLKALRDPSAL